MKTPTQTLRKLNMSLVLTTALLIGCQTTPAVNASGVKTNKPVRSGGGLFGPSRQEEFPASFVDEFPPININDASAYKTQDVFNTGDVATIRVYGVDELSGEFVVNREGNINFPLIGQVEVMGLTTLELQDILVQKYGAKYLQNPSITVLIEQRDLGRIVVDGSVIKPGVFELSEVIFLSEAVAMANGLTSDADKDEIFVVRTINGERKVKIVDLDLIRTAGAPDVPIIPGDIIYVQDNTGKAVFREFLRALPLVSTLAIIGIRR